MLALVQNNTVLATFPQGGYREVAPGVLAPATDGWSHGDYSIQTVVFPPVPEGYLATSQSIIVVDGVPTAEYVLEELLTPSPGIDDYRLAIDLHVNATARSRDYNDAATLAGYAASTVPPWAVDASAFVAWRDAVWVHTFTELDKVQHGQRPQPSVEDFIAELPVIAWPT